MNKQDLKIILELAEMANQTGRISLDSYQAVGSTIGKVKSAFAQMGDQDVLVVKNQPGSAKPSVSAVFPETGKSTES